MIDLDVLLGRLRNQDLLRTLDRRIGGVRSGSAGFVWHLGPTGERLLRSRAGSTPRRRYSEPSRHFVNHTLAVADLAVRLIEASRTGAFDIASLATEPANWQKYLSPTGVRRWLKPDLHIITVVGDFEDHWFIEADLDTEHLPVVVKQCRAHIDYLASGRYQAAHDVVPIVLWIAPTASGASGIQTAIDRNLEVTANVFRVSTAADLTRELALPDHPARPP